MNEAANFCPYPCENPAQYAEDNDLPPAPPPVRSPPRRIPGFPGDFQPQTGSSKRVKRGEIVERSPRGNGHGHHGAGKKGTKIGLEDRDLINPPYVIANEAGGLSNKTIDTDIVHAGEGYVEYDTHNLYGTSKLSDSYF